jgi:hypothetical protein
VLLIVSIVRDIYKGDEDEDDQDEKNKDELESTEGER